jgi:hypothetical protein
MPMPGRVTVPAHRTGEQEALCVLLGVHQPGVEKGALVLWVLFVPLEGLHHQRDTDHFAGSWPAERTAISTSLKAWNTAVS